jgi:hypothetical protein
LIRQGAGASRNRSDIRYSRKEIEMHTIHQSRTSSFGLVTLIALALVAPLPVSAEEPNLAAAPAGPSWDETSGYGAIEASRAAASELIAEPAGTTAHIPSVAANRVITARHALDSGDLGSMQEDALAAVVAASATWDESSGYGSVEASRAAAAGLLAPPTEP